MPSDSPRVVILCPYRPGFPDRDRLMGFTRAWWARDHPTWPIFTADGRPLDEPFNRSAALNAAAAEAGDWDVAVTIDGDVLLAAEPVRAAVQIAATTGRPVLAYHERVHLTQNATDKILAGYMGNWRYRGAERSVFLDSCSSAMVVRRDMWDAVGGFDESFVGWGWEDVAFRCAVETVAGCELIKLAATLYHLNHVVSSGNNRLEPTFQANEARGALYRRARFDPAAMAVLLDEAGRARAPHPVAAPPSPTRIPRILHRSVPAVTTAEVEGWWKQAGEQNPSWELRTHRDPLDPADWPMTSDLWDRCTSGAQLAGLVRLEALYVSGGLYYDSDLQPLQPIPDALLSLPAVAAWEDRRTVPDAVLGCEPRHPAFAEMIGLARDAVAAGKDAWASGPGVTTAILPGRDDVLLLPPGCWYPWHWKEKATIDQYEPEPWAWGIHMWHASWLPKDVAAATR